MAFELPDGKTARTLQEQVKFLTEKLRDLYAVVNQIGISIVVVETLPEEGEPYKVYLVPAEDPETGNYYEEYIWYDDAWEMIGSTKIDLSDYCTLSTEQTLTGHKTFSHITTQNLDSGEGDLVYASSGVNIKPYADDSVNLGTSDNRWKDIYASGKYYIGATNKFLESFEYGVHLKAGGLSLFVEGDLRPYTNGTVDLGSSSQKWKDAYFSGTVNANYIGNSYNTLYCKVSSLSPENNSMDLGKSGYAWKDLYLGGHIYLGSADIRDSGSFLTITGRSIKSGDLLPIDSASYLGSAGSKWKDLYLSGNLTDGTNSATVADIAALITYAKAQGWIS